ncbi:anti-sigma factor [Nocardia yunnanensis]|uniref:anti-sigma factor n=1 Tax=Nocardia yunnanensis TaxID=2382165 RepID=UPI0013C50BEC|nr:anti-sigma factor [Nocardia yunnanensis]
MDRYLDGSGRELQARSGQLELRLPARFDQLQMLRALTETIMLSADFTIDQVIDMRVALDEVATAMMLCAVPDASVELVFRYDPAQIEIRISSMLETDGAFDGNSFGRDFLETLTDSMRSSSGAFDPVRNGYPVTVHLQRLRSEDDDR